MKLHKLLIHDLRCGLLRGRYLSIPAVIAVPCFEYFNWTKGASTSGSWMDIMFYIFKGQEPIDISSAIERLFEFPMPMVWLFVMGACLFLNLDYYLYDLSLTGQQIIVRCGNRRMWFLSKCIWNVLSTVLYFMMIGLTAFICTLILNGSISINTTQEIQQIIMGNFELAGITAGQAILLGLVSPFLTLAALNILQMTLCIFVKPIISFLCSAGILVLSVYVSNGLVLGNGAMTIRTLAENGSNVTVAVSIMLSIMIILACVAVGTIVFKRTDIFPSDD